MYHMKVRNTFLPLCVSCVFPPFRTPPERVSDYYKSRTAKRSVRVRGMPSFYCHIVQKCLGFPLLMQQAATTYLLQKLQIDLGSGVED